MLKIFVHNDRNNENGNKLRTYRQYKYVLSCSSYVKSVKSVKNRIFRRTLSAGEACDYCAVSQSMHSQS